MNTLTKTQSNVKSSIRRWLLGAVAGMVIAQTLALAPAQAAPASKTSLNQYTYLAIDENAVQEIGRFYINPTRQYETQWMEIFRNSAPNWRFARAWGHTTCLPSRAYSADFVMNPGADLKAWPIPGQSGCTKEEDTNEMVTYVDPRLCDENTLRIGYWLYFKKDGFALAGGTAGHRHDWETAVVELKRLGNKPSNYWYYSVIKGSHHHGFHTGNMFDGFVERVPNTQHPVMYVGWAHHAMHYTKGGRSDVASTSNNDLRNSYIKLDSWNNLVMIPFEPTPAFNILKTGDYGRANPPLKQDTCGIP